MDEKQIKKANINLYKEQAGEYHRNMKLFLLRRI